MDDISSILIGFIIFSIIVLACVFLYIKGNLLFIYLRAILFLYVLSTVIISLRLYFIEMVKRLGNRLGGFKLITPFYLQPRLEGTYKNNWWQIHYVSKETGKDPGVLRTYIKLQYKKPKRFDEKKLKAYRNYCYKNCRIITIKHITRPYKNYLLLKRNKFTFNESERKDMMDFLLKVARQTRIKRKS